MSARYERSAPRKAAEDDPSALWKSLDRGEDPTAHERS
ncbi:Trp biosynthesis-associated membrane protein [Actinomadura luteofluorescens]